ncbi:uroporphyrinogen-III C-methyltransferase [Nakamurella leprariae]|uniref:uroporphyrinogen-III C-methyltransferase n=1 Tax=Nakamurella leprariae TaxID=2803911 RepID=A0A938YHY4_9ACTN|nr:uroporphyrinogen-III C-methyltransferase [Nakamurella leprariae]MBM9468168.1 uroporphyrinogen-III C-methyltransferase [Nakamurella leprariae]
MSRRSGWRVELPVAGRPVLVVGGGPEALGRVASLRAEDAAVTVVASELSAALADLAARDLITAHPRDVLDGDVERAWLVIAATGDEAADARVRALADTHRRFCLGGSGRGAAPVPGTGGRRRLGGRVILVGGGPGDPGLITMAGLAALHEADVVVTDRLAPLAVLEGLRPTTEIIDVSKIPGGRTTPQQEINRLLVEHALAGRTVVRLKGGDNFVFGRGGEEWQACARAGVEVQLVPGVTSAVAVPALAGIPVTHRTANQGFTVISAHVAPDDPRSTLDYAALARTGTSLVVLMGVGTLAAVARALLAAGMPADTPAAIIADGGLPSQRTVRAGLAEIAERAEEAGIGAPAVTVIGSVAAFDPAVGSTPGGIDE